MWCNRSVGYSWCTVFGPSASCGEVNIQRTEVKPRLLKAMKCPLQPQYVLFILYFWLCDGVFWTSAFPWWTPLSLPSLSGSTCHSFSIQPTHRSPTSSDVQLSFFSVWKFICTFALRYSCSGSSLLQRLWSQSLVLHFVEYNMIFLADLNF